MKLGMQRIFVTKYICVCTDFSMRYMNLRFHENTNFPQTTKIGIREFQ